MDRPDNNLIVIFGASGDLTKRKLIPALFELYLQNLLPEKFAILGVSRSEMPDAEYRDILREGIQEFGSSQQEDRFVREFLGSVHYLPFDSDAPDSFKHLREKVCVLHEQCDTGGNTMYYLSTPPHLFGKIAQGLKEQRLHKPEDPRKWVRIIIEKPFGSDLESSQKLNEELTTIFREKQIYRIDHYLGKETVQNVLAFRFGNVLFDPIWNRKYVDRVVITASESIGVGHRGGYYDSAGAIRDMIQNHLLQVTALIGMEPPARFTDDAVRNETIKLFQSIRSFNLDSIRNNVVLGQYTSGEIEGKEVTGYREEEGVPAWSRTETYAAMKFYIDNWRWSGVPFYIRTGKRMKKRFTQIAIRLKKTPHHLFSESSTLPQEHNDLILRIQPDEEIAMHVGIKVPGAGFDIKNVRMNFKYASLPDVHLPTAYERLLLDCMLGDATLYTRADAVEAAWAFLDPVLKAKDSGLNLPVYGYEAGSWGPQEADRLFFGEDENGWDCDKK